MSRLSAPGGPVLELAITGKKYYNCMYPEFPESGEMPLSQALDIIDAAAGAGFRRLIITGSEPMRHSEFLEICYGAGRARELYEIGLSTRGAELRSMAPAVKGAGIGLLEIRLDSLQQVKYDFISGGKLSQVFRGIAAAERTGFIMRTVTRLIRGVNDDEIGDFCDIVRRRCFEQWFFELPHGDPNFLSSDFVLERKPRLEALGLRDGVRRFLLGHDAGIVCLAPYSACGRVRISPDAVLDGSVSLSALDGDALRSALRGALMRLSGGQNFTIEEE